jgi:hypothetical protein
VEVGSAFIAGGEAPECVEPGEGAFDDVSDPAEAGSVGFTTTCDAVLDAANGNQPAVLVEVVSAVGVEGAGPCGVGGRHGRPRMGCGPVARSGRQSSAEGRSRRASPHGGRRASQHPHGRLLSPRTIPLRGERPPSSRVRART